MTDTEQTAPAIRQDGPEPLWIQAVNFILGEIASGELPPGTRLPPERELCVRLGISRVTLRKALGKLVEDGVLRAWHGRGWYVAEAVAGKEWPNHLESFTETAARMGLEASSRVLRAETRPANLDEAEELSVAPGTPLFHLVRVRQLNNVPIALDTTHIPLELAPEMADVDFAAASLYEQLERQGIDLQRGEATIEATAADPTLAELFDVDPGSPVLTMRQLVFDQRGRAIFVSEISYAGARYRLRTAFVRSSH